MYVIKEVLYNLSMITSFCAQLMVTEMVLLMYPRKTIMKMIKYKTTFFMYQIHFKN